jgi:hypothetical protein
MEQLRTALLTINFHEIEKENSNITKEQDFLDKCERLTDFQSALSSDWWFK